METIFAMLFLLSLILIPIVLIKPSVLGRIFRFDFTRKQAGLIVTYCVVLFFILFATLVSPSDDMQLQNLIVSATVQPTLSEIKEAMPLIEKATIDAIVKEDVAETVVDTLTIPKNTILVARVIDGDTVELESGDRVRFIGIDAPESVNPNTSIECFSNESSNKNKELIEGKYVTLEKDVTDKDKYGRLLRYVYIDDIFVNEYLIRNGFANASSYPPDIKYQDIFREAEQYARNNKSGLWGACVSNIKGPQLNETTSLTTTPTPTSPRSTLPIPLSPLLKTDSPPSKQGYACDCKKTCPNISSCEEAQYLLKVCNCKARDFDKDGIACDGKPLNCQQ